MMQAYIAMSHPPMGYSMSTTFQGCSVTPRPFDSDSYLLMIDNCCSKCVTNCCTDFVGTPTPVRAQISGVGGPIPVLLKGTVKWKIEDDTGRVHIFRIPGTFYAPKAPFRMLSPQHWSKEINRGWIGTKGAWCTIYEDRVTLCWDNNLYVRNVKLDPATNLATLLTAPVLEKIF